MSEAYGDSNSEFVAPRDLVGDKFVVERIREGEGKEYGTGNVQANFYIDIDGGRVIGVGKLKSAIGKQLQNPANVAAMLGKKWSTIITRPSKKLKNDDGTPKTIYLIGIYEGA
jgi:hypothetical protein